MNIDPNIISAIIEYDILYSLLESSSKLLDSQPILLPVTIRIAVIVDSEGDAIERWEDVIGRRILCNCW